MSRPRARARRLRASDCIITATTERSRSLRQSTIGSGTSAKRAPSPRTIPISERSESGCSRGMSTGTITSRPKSAGRASSTEAMPPSGPCPGQRSGTQSWPGRSPETMTDRQPASRSCPTARSRKVWPLRQASPALSRPMREDRPPASTIPVNPSCRASAIIDTLC